MKVMEICQKQVLYKFIFNQNRYNNIGDKGCEYLSNGLKDLKELTSVLETI